MITAIIPAAGASRRFRTEEGPLKQFLPLAGRPVVAHTLAAFEGCDLVSEVVVAVPADMADAFRRDVLIPYGLNKVVAVVPGGEERRDSVRICLAAANPSTEFVVIHDAVRPFVTPELISSSIGRSRETGAAVVAVRVKDTIKMCEGGYVLETPRRDSLWSIQTPQTFRYDLICRAHRAALSEGWATTDDAALVERMGGKVAVQEGAYENIKITTPEDLPAAKAIWSARHGDATTLVGTGYDIHRLVVGRRLVLGGVEVPFDRGLLGHSDADALSHAIADALLGAVGAGDIGLHFPDTSEEYRGLSSLVLLQRVAGIMSERYAEIVNVDATILAERPRLSAFLPGMRERVAESLGVKAGAVSIKATTCEGLGEIGRGEGMACHAVALVKRWRGS